MSFLETTCSMSVSHNEEKDKEADLSQPQNDCLRSSMTQGKTFEDLPLEVISKILTYLPDDDLITCALHINEVWKYAAQFQKVWHNRNYCINEESKETELVEISQIIPQLSTLQLIDEEEVFEAIYSDGLLRINCDLQMKSEMVKSLFRKCRNIKTLFCPSFLLQKAEFTVAIADMQNLKSLILLNSKGYFDSPLLLRLLADGTPNLQEVDFHDILYDIKDMKYFIEKKGAKLLALSINWCTKDNVSALPLLVSCQNSLKQLEIHVNGQGGFETAEILNTIKDLSALTAIRLLDVCDIDSGEFASALLTSSFTQLLSFSMTCAFTIQDDVLLALCKSCPNLLEIKIQDSRYITEKGLQLISNCSGLLVLDLCGCNHLKGLGTLEHCSKLNALYLYDCWQLQDAAILDVIYKLKELKILHIISRSVLDFPVSTLRTHLPQLKVFGINGYYGTTEGELEEPYAPGPGFLDLD